MTWFTLQSLLVIGLAFALGLLVGRLAWGTGRSRPVAAVPDPVPEPEPEQVPEPTARATRPATTAAPSRRPRRGDDLERLVGIGPKIADALHAAGLSTYPELASASEDILRLALRAKGLQFAPTLPTWPQQAQLLAAGDETAFTELSRSIDDGDDAVDTERDSAVT